MSVALFVLRQFHSQLPPASFLFNDSLPCQRCQKQEALQSVFGYFVFYFLLVTAFNSYKEIPVILIF